MLTYLFYLFNSIFIQGHPRGGPRQGKRKCCLPRRQAGIEHFSNPGLEIKKIFRSPFGDQPEKYSRQMQIFSRQFVKCK